MGLTFEKVWAMFEESGRRFEESDRRMDRRMEETDRLIKETGLQMKETDRKMEETDRQIKETGLQMKELGRRMEETRRLVGNLGSKLGDLIEHIVQPNIVEKFRALGYAFTKASIRNTYRDKTTNRAITEVDILLENGDYVLAVEVKTQVKSGDIEEHLNRMEILRTYADERNDKRKFLGAVAAAIFNEPEKVYALKQGFYVLEQTGDTIQIAETPSAWKPREW
jgi:hypothetical protein